MVNKEGHLITRMIKDLTLGGLYLTKFDQRPFRVIGYDEYEVFYDCLWSAGKWTFSGNFKSKTIFYRMSSKLFNEKSELLEIKPLTDVETKYFRSDLPMRFGRTKDLNWGDPLPNWQQLAVNLKNIKLQTEQLVLVPYGLKGGYQKGVVIECKEGPTELEIIKKAFPIQQTASNAKSNGIGFYRLGYEKGLPRYAIGEYVDKAGIMTE
jgi:hypothetical protein